MSTLPNSGYEEKLYAPLPPPDDFYVENPQEKLTGEEQGMYEAVLAHFADPGFKLPGFSEAEFVGTGEKEERKWEGNLIEEEKFWLSCECILRYLRASKWKTQTAIARLESTLKWRRAFGIYDVVTADLVSPEAETGKGILFGYDAKGRPGFHMIPSRQNTEEGPGQIQFFVWLMERCVDLMPPGVENLAIFLNFASKAKNSSLATARTVLNIVQDHYPERMGISLIINVPFLVNAFFKLILPFVDPITREKIKFNPRVVEDGYVKTEWQVKEWWGGDKDFEYVHDKYWPALVQMCEERKARWKNNWMALGGKVGVGEWDYKTQ